MKRFTRKDLNLEYQWRPDREHDNKWIEGFPAEKNLDPGEGYEVLPFLNRYCRSRNYSAIEKFHALEMALRQLPSKIRAHSQVKDWLDVNCCF